jgi:hypothetical protein
MKQELAAIFLLWLALDIPLGIFIGKFIHFGMSEAMPSTRRQTSSPESPSHKAQLIPKLANLRRRQCRAARGGD